MLFTSRVCPVPGPRARYIVLLLLAACPPAVLAESGNPDNQVTLEWVANHEPDIAGYKVHYGTQSRHYTELRDVGLATTIDLGGLTGGTTYFCNVTAYDTEGLESAFSEELVFTYYPPPPAQPSDWLILLDVAEAIIGSPGGEGQTILLNFEAPMAEDYLVWCRLMAPDPASDTLLVTLDDGPEEVFQVPSPLSPDWLWTPVRIGGSSPRVYSLDQGPHALTIVLPAGAQLDRLFLTSDPNFLPSDDLPRSGEAVVITGHPTSRSITAGAETAFNVTAVATGPVSYQWKKNNLPIPGSTTRDLVISNATTVDTGDYSVVVFSGSAAQQSDAAYLQVVSTSPGLRVNRLTVAAGGVLSFEVQGESGASLEIFASSDLISWQSIASVVNSNGIIQVVDPQALSQNRRFYRLAKAVDK